MLVFSHLFVVPRPLQLLPPTVSFFVSVLRLRHLPVDVTPSPALLPPVGGRDNIIIWVMGLILVYG